MLTSPRLVFVAALAAAAFTSGTASAATPACTIRGTDRSETLTGTAGRDVICGMGGNDRLRGLGGDDVLLGGDGHDVLEGGAGNDDLQGEKGNDVLAGNDGDDSLSGGDGHDALAGGAGADTLLGGGADDLLAGGGGKDSLDGGPGADAFLGGADADVVKAKDDRRDAIIDCGAGQDTLTADAKDPKGRECEGAVTPPPPPPAPKADLSVSLTDSADPVVQGDTVEYRFTVANAGPATATGVTVATTLPADATADPATGCAADGAVVTCSLGDLASGASATGTLVVHHGSTGAKSVTSVVRSAVEDGNAENNTATQSTQVDPKPAPSGADVSVSVDAPPVASPLANVNYAVSVHNAGPLAADAVTLVMDIDEAWSAITRPSGCTQSMFPTTKVTCSLGSLASGDTVSKVLGVSWSTAGDRTVKATVSTSTTDPAAANNSEIEHTSVGSSSAT
jgi:uncharacterized repeat protein (TIGR01451 family)